MAGRHENKQQGNRQQAELQEQKAVSSHLESQLCGPESELETAGGLATLKSCVP